VATDYFKRSEFRDITGDNTPNVKYKDDDIDRAQAEVIEALEEWAGTAWPNVGVVLGSGGITTGTATLTLTAAGFDEARDVGKEITVAGAGAAGALLVTTISSVSSTTVAVLATNAGTTVSGAVVKWGDADGTAQDARSRTETFDGGKDLLLLGRVPVIALTTFTRDGVAVASTDYDLYPETGTIRFESPALSGRRVFVVTYTYGFQACPWSVKRPAILAAKTLLTKQEGRSGIPAGVTAYTSEGTRFELDGEKRIGGEGPWPWDQDASRSVSAYWNPRRSRGVAFV
jgi:hypothetical protein